MNAYAKSIYEEAVNMSPKATLGYEYVQGAILALVEVLAYIIVTILILSFIRFLFTVFKERRLYGGWFWEEEVRLKKVKKERGKMITCGHCFIKESYPDLYAEILERIDVFEEKK